MKADKCTTLLHESSAFSYLEVAIFIFNFHSKSMSVRVRLTCRTECTYGKCSKISNTLKLRTPKIITENNFKNILKNRTLTFFLKSEFLKLRTQVIFGGKSLSVYLFVPSFCARFTFNVQRVSGSDIWKVPFHLNGYSGT